MDFDVGFFFRDHDPDNLFVGSQNGILFGARRFHTDFVRLHIYFCPGRLSLMGVEDIRRKISRLSQANRQKKAGQ